MDLQKYPIKVAGFKCVPNGMTCIIKLTLIYRKKDKQETKTCENQLESRYVDNLCFIKSSRWEFGLPNPLYKPRVETLGYNKAVPMGLRTMIVCITPYIQDTKT